MNMASNSAELNINAHTSQRSHFISLMMSALSWLLALILALLFVGMLLLLQQTVFEPQNEATIRKVDVVLPPPPPPPPPLEMQQPQASPESPSINVIGLGGGPTMNFATTPSLGLDNLEKADLPKFDINSLSVRQSMSVDFPLMEVTDLDKRPRLVSSEFVSFPHSLVKKGIKTVPTKVQIIIDDKGSVYIKKITDPVYPEMIEVIRKWAKHARFTIPTKNGLPVQAIYDYTLQFEYKI
ncbi:hypothetical protein QX776_14645 [Alteromonadaceae bacterium BrNp21-10]|nr:hypothetical protein [Alteromonadaceae bacterium BrNp21-10]